MMVGEETGYDCWNGESEVEATADGPDPKEVLMKGYEVAAVGDGLT